MERKKETKMERISLVLTCRNEQSHSKLRLLRLLGITTLVQIAYNLLVLLYYA